MTVRNAPAGEMTPKEIAQMQKEREPRIRAALKVLAPESRFRKECESDIDDAINAIEVTTAHKKKETHALKSLHSALIRASRLIRLAGLSWWVDLKDEIALCTRQLALPTCRPDSRQAAAVKEAIYLIRKWNPTCPTGLTRRSKWHRLSTILYGDKKKDLFNHMRAYRRAARPNSKQISL